MNAIELHEAILARVQEVREKGIWERAIHVMDHSGYTIEEDRHENSTSFFGGHTGDLSTLEVPVENKLFLIKRCRSGVGVYPRIDRLKIMLNRELVFDAGMIVSKSDLDYRLSELIIAVGEPKAPIYILVTAYSPGEWEKWLHLSVIKGALEGQKGGNEELERKAQAERAKEAEEREKTRPLTELELDLAKRFEIQV